MQAFNQDKRIKRLAEVLWVFLVLGFGFGIGNAQVDQSQPFRILVVPSDQVDRFLEKKLQTPHRLMTVKEFEDLKKSIKAPGQKPKTIELASANYQAVWKETYLEGTAQWSFGGGFQDPFTLPVDPFNLAIRKWMPAAAPTWLGEWEKDKLSLVAPQGGVESVEFEWSARADQLPTGHHLQIQIPPTATGAFDITHGPEWLCFLSSKGVQETFPSKAMPGKKVTRLLASGERQLDITMVSPTNLAASSAQWVGKILSRHRIQEFACSSEFELTLGNTMFSGKALELETTPGMEITDVSSQAIQQWSFQPGQGSQKGKLFIVPSSKTIMNRTVLIKGIQSPIDQRDPWWRSPWVKPLNAPPCLEQITVSVEQGLLVEEVSNGDFTGLPGESGKAMIQMNFLGGGISQRVAGIQYPAIHFAIQPSRFRAHVYSNFSPEPTSSSLVSRIYLRQIHGAMQFFSLEIPGNFKIDNLFYDGNGNKVRDWSLVQRGNSQILRIELDSPILAANTTEESPTLDLPCIFLFLSSRNQSARFKDLTFPAIVPSQASSLEGYLGISTNRNLQKIRVRTDYAVCDPPVEMPVHMQRSQFLYHYHANAPSGFVDLEPVKGLVKSTLQSHYHASPNSLKGELEFSIQAETGTAEFFDIIVPVGMQPDLWSWKSQAKGQVVARVDRLSFTDPTIAATILGMATSWNVLPTLEVLETPMLWRVHFTKGFSGKETLHLQASWSAPFSGFPTQLPLVFLRDEPSAAQVVEVTSGLSGHPRFQLRNVDREPVAGVQTKRFVAHSPYASISLEIPDPHQTATGSILNCETIKHNGPGDSVVHQVQIDLQNWESDYFSIGLPKNAFWLGATIQGKPLSQAPPQSGENFLIPLSTEDRNSRLSIRYSLHVDNRWLWKRTDDTGPRFQQTPLRNLTWWVTPPDWTPVAPFQWKKFSGLEMFQQGAGWFPWQPQSPQSSPDQAVKLKQVLQSRMVIRSGAQALTLVDLLDQVTRETKLPMIVDTFAIRGMPGEGQAGSVLVEDFLRDSKLVLAPLGSGFLLTLEAQAKFLHSASRYSHWQSFFDRVQGIGTDPSGRFVSAWFFASQPEAYQPTRNDSNGRYLAGIPLDQAGMKFDGSDSGILLFHPGRMQALGAFLALCLLLFLRVQNLQAGTGAWLMLLGAFGAAMTVQPALLKPLLWWSFVVLASESIGAFRARWAIPVGVESPNQEKTVLDNLAAKGALLAAWLLAGSGFQAAPLAVTDVFFLAPNPSKPASGAYLVPESYLKMELPQAGEVILEKTEFRGKLQDDSLLFEFTLDVKSSGPANLDLSTKGVWFKDNLLLNGKSALGISHSSGAFAIRIPSSGAHQLTGEFRVPLQDEQFRKAATFTLPSCVQSRLTCDLGPQTELVSVAGVKGFYETTKAGNRSLLECDIGKTSLPISIRWEKGPLRPRALPSAREAYFLEITPGGTKLQSLWDLQAGDAGTDFFECFVPKSLHPEGFQVLGQTGEKLLVTHFEKKPGPGQDRLVLQFNRRFRGEVQIAGWFQCLDLPGSKWSVPIPTPVASFRDKSSYLAYQAKGCEVQRAEIPTRITGVDPKTFAPFWKTQDRPDSEALSYACLLGREPPGKPVMILNVAPSRQRFDVTQKISIVPLPFQLAMDFQVSIQDHAAKTPMLVWQLDSPHPMVLSKLQGEGIVHWQQSGKKVFLWLKNHTGKINFKAQAAFSTPFQRQGFSLKVPRSLWAGAGKVETMVSISSMDGFSNLVSPSPGFVLQDNSYKSTRIDASLGLEFRPEPLSAKVESTLKMETRDTREWLQLELRFTGLRPGVSSYQLNLEDWPAENLEWEAPPQVEITRKPLKDNIRPFQILFPKQLTGTQVIRFQSPVGKQEGGATPVLPDWSLQGAQSFTKVYRVMQSDLMAIGQKIPGRKLSPPEIFWNQMDVYPMGEAGTNLRTTWWLFAREDAVASMSLPPQCTVQFAQLNQKQLEIQKAEDGANRFKISLKPGFHMLVLAHGEGGSPSPKGPLFIPKLEGLSSPETLVRAFDVHESVSGAMSPENALDLQVKAVLSLSSKMLEWKKESKQTGTGFTPLAGIMERISRQLETMNRENPQNAEGSIQAGLVREKIKELGALRELPPEDIYFPPTFPSRAPARIWILADANATKISFPRESTWFSYQSAWLGSLLWLLLAYALVLAWNRPWSAMILKSIWPECLMVASALAAFLSVLPVFGAGLLAMGVFSRGVLATRAVRLRFFTGKIKPDNVLEA